MTQINISRRGSKDVFKSFLVRNASFDGEYEIPWIRSQSSIPQKLVPFSKALNGSEYDAWIHFYEDDVAFERLWNNPKKYLPIIKRYKGVISPDFSVYRDMPLVMQQWNVYRNHAIGYWLQSQGIPVIANVRWGDERTFEISCAGVPRNSIIAIGSHGCIKVNSDRTYFIKGLDYIIATLHPQTIVVYGSLPASIFDKHISAGIKMIHFDSEYKATHRKKVMA